LIIQKVRVADDRGNAGATAANKGLREGKEEKNQ
jgi:hypothetical protein